MEKGYSFEWDAFTNPVLRHPSGRVHKLEVEDYVPVLACGSADPGSPSVPKGAVGKEATIPEGHFLTHTPKHPCCRHCQEAKITAKPARKKIVDDQSVPIPNKFGKLVVADHIILGKEVETSIDDDSVVFVVTDIGTGWVMSYPDRSKATNSCVAAFQHFAGDNDKIERVYCDNAREIEKAAAEELSWRVDTSTPYRHTSNGVAERSNRRIIDGTRTLLHTAGLPHCYWSLACVCYCVLRNVSDPNRSNKTAYENRFGVPFHGALIPFGCLVSYRPPPEKESTSQLKFEPRTRYGLFAGYHFHSGGHWPGDYLIIDAHAYASAESSRLCRPFRVKEVLPPASQEFPVRTGSLRCTSDSRIVHDYEESEKVWDPEVAGGVEATPPVDAPSTEPETETTVTQEALTPAETDKWEVRGDLLVRVHKQPRHRLFVPLDADDPCPWPLHDIDVFRDTVAHLDLDDINQSFLDIWGTDNETIDRRDLGQPWTGETKFYKYVAQSEGWCDVAGRRTRRQKTNRPPHIWPELWHTMSQKERKDAIERWAPLAEHFAAARAARFGGGEMAGSGATPSEEPSSSVHHPVSLLEDTSNGSLVQDFPFVMPVIPSTQIDAHRQLCVDSNGFMGYGGHVLVARQ
jgi:hypothetical protein